MMACGGRGWIGGKGWTRFLPILPVLPNQP
jgi:hypothetical protein